MEVSKLDAAREGMAMARKLGAPADLAKAKARMSEAAKMGASQAGGFIAELSLQLGESGAMSEASAGELAQIASHARKTLGSDAERLEFMIWTRGGLAAASLRQGADPLWAGRAFAKAYAGLEADAWAQLMLSQPFYSSEGCPNACDAAKVLEGLRADAGAKPRARKGS